MRKHSTRVRGMSLAAICLGMGVLASPSYAQSAWTAVQKVEPYAIGGTTGPELYASIGQNGPKIGPTRAIALTNFKLTWTRDYRPQGNACVLVTARPKLTITTTLPRPSARLTGSAKALWQTFIDGITRHEAVHGDSLIALTRTIEAETTGLRVEDDRACKKIRDAVSRRVGELYQAQRQEGRDFDRVEMSNGGNVHQLILNLVNGR